MRKQKPVHLWIDQYGQHIYARTVKELRINAGGGRVSPMFRDLKAGGAIRVGYVVGPRWFSRYAPVTSKA